jgi:hypothetical protein
MRFVLVRRYGVLWREEHTAHMFTPSLTTLLFQGAKAT